MGTPRKLARVCEQDLFEAAGAALLGWGERDYERNDRGEYTFTEQRNAYAMWLAARQPRSQQQPKETT